ncbi:MAG: hypothetical protein AAB596_00085 [Patescibacteria group bacterium]
MKKIIIIITAIIFISAISFGVYFAWKKSKEILTPPTANQQPTTNNQQQITLEKKLKIISDQEVFDFWLAANATSTEIFYINNQGQILKVKPDVEDEIISDRIISNLKAVEADNSGNKIIVKANKIEIFDIKKKIWQEINALAAGFSVDGTKVAYLENTGATAISNLIIKDLKDAKQKTTKVLSFNQYGFDLKWITSDKVLLIPKSSASYDNEIWSIDIKNKALSIFANGKGLLIDFAKDGSWGLMHSINQEGESDLKLIELNGKVKADLQFSSFPKKCLVNFAKIYCAVSLGYNTIKKPLLPDDYLKRAFYSDDRIYEVDITNNTFLEIPLNSKIAIDVYNLELSGNQLIFINRYDKKLYSLDM